MQEERACSVDEILAELIAQRLEGAQPDLDGVCARHPGRADEIRARFAELQRLDALWATVAARAKGAPPAATAPGTRLGEFEILRELGRGGMGVVYLGRQERLNRQVALKVIPQASALSETTKRRFLREGEALAALSHANIVPIFAAGESGGSLYIAMEYVDGVTLSELLAAVRSRSPRRKASEVWNEVLAGRPGRADDRPAGEGRPGPDETRTGAPGARPSADDEPGEGEQPDVDAARRGLDREYIRTCCEVIRSIASALQSAHEQGILHRDVKPGNILIDRDGRARLVDFGLAAVNTQPHVTVSGEFFGTPYYVSPEQAGGRHSQLDARADVYSLGATLYECLTLSPPYEAASAVDVLRQVLHAEAPDARKSNPRIARDLNTVVMKAISKAPADRYGSAAAFSDDVERFLSYQPILARRPSLTTKLLKRIRRRPVHAALIAAIILAVGGLGLYWLAYRQARTESRAKALFELGLGHATGFTPDGRRVRRNPQEAVRCFEQAARLGHSGAMRELVALYTQGKGTKVDRGRALHWAREGMARGDVTCQLHWAEHLLATPGRRQEGRKLLELAAEKDAAAMCRLGLLLLLGEEGVPTDRARALELLRGAAKLDNAQALLYLGRACEDLCETDRRDLAEARRWYARAAEEGEAMGGVRLAVLLRAGLGGPKDAPKADQLVDAALKQLTASAEAGVRKATQELALIYLKGMGVPPDEEQGRRWAKRGMDAGDLACTVYYGQSLLSVPDRQPEGVALLQKAAAASNPVAMRLVGRALLTGSYGQARDRPRALKLLGGAADRGDAAAMCYLGMAYDGWCEPPERNYRLARQWYERAARRQSAQAMLNLAALYRDGHGVPKDEAECERWLRKAADGLRDPAARKTLGKWLLQRGRAADAQRAVRYLTQAADQGHAQAATLLGRAYHAGEGVEQSYPKALRWFQRGHELKDISATVWLVEMYDRGLGAPKDPAKGTALVKSLLPLAHRAPQFWVAYAMRLEQGLGLAAPQPQAAFAYYKKAAEAGDLGGMAHLARCYGAGIGTKEDAAAAARWDREYRKAIEAIRRRLKKPAGRPATAPSSRPGPVRGARMVPRASRCVLVGPCLAARRPDAWDTRLVLQRNFAQVS